MYTLQEWGKNLYYKWSSIFEKKVIKNKIILLVPFCCGQTNAPGTVVVELVVVRLVIVLPIEVVVEAVVVVDDNGMLDVDVIGLLDVVVGLVVVIVTDTVLPVVGPTLVHSDGETHCPAVGSKTKFPGQFCRFH